VLLDLVKFLADKGFAWWVDRRELRLRVHAGVFSGSTQPCLFVTALNLSRSREIEITHVWFAVAPEVHLLRPERPLPNRLKPDESWETWVDVDALPKSIELDDQIYKLARARLSTGDIVKSKEDDKIPSIGSVPGGPLVGH
jgi:hypothetical protein